MGAWNGPLWIPAWQLHDRDPTLIMWKVLQTSNGSNPLVLYLYIQAVYNNMSGSAFRRNNIARLHVFPGEEVEMLCNLKPMSWKNHTINLMEIFFSTCPLMLHLVLLIRSPRRSWKMWRPKYLKWSLFQRSCPIIQKRKCKASQKSLTIQKIFSRNNTDFWTGLLRK